MIFVSLSAVAFLVFLAIGHIFGPRENSHNCVTQGHLFKPRYDKGAPTNTLPFPVTENEVDRWKGDLIEHVIKLSRPKTYIRDICIYCGEQVERP